MRIGVVVLARNEETTLAKTLYALFNNTTPPNKVVLVNDNSTDDTKEIAEGFGCNVVDFPYKHDNWVTQKELSHVYNQGLQQFDKDDLDYIMILGADHILSNDYIEKITQRMDKDESIMLASGVINDELTIAPRGSGRVVRFSYWKKLGLRYPLNYGYESWLCFKVLSDGYKIESYNDVTSITQRKTGLTYKPKLYFHYGQAMKALGYSRLYSTLRAVIMLKRKKLRGSIYLLLGFYSNYEPQYELDLREYVKRTHNYEIRKILTGNPQSLKKAFNILLHA